MEKIRFDTNLRHYTSRNIQKFKNLIEDNESMKVKKKPQETFQEAQNWKGFFFELQRTWEGLNQRCIDLTTLKNCI